MRLPPWIRKKGGERRSKGAFWRPSRDGGSAERQPESAGSGFGSSLERQARRVGRTFVMDWFCRPSRPSCSRVDSTADCRPRLGLFRPSGTVVAPCTTHTGMTINSTDALSSPNHLNEGPQHGRGTTPFWKGFAPNCFPTHSLLPTTNRSQNRDTYSSDVPKSVWP